MPEEVHRERADILPVLADVGEVAMAQAVLPGGRMSGMANVKMDREQFAALMAILDAIYCRVSGYEGPTARSKALDYMGKENGKAKGWLPEDRSDPTP